MCEKENQLVYIHIFAMWFMIDDIVTVKGAGLNFSKHFEVNLKKYLPEVGKRLAMLTFFFFLVVVVGGGGVIKCNCIKLDIK